MRQPSEAPQANLVNSSVSRRGSRRLTIRMRPIPVSRCSAGKMAGSGSKRRLLAGSDRVGVLAEARLGQEVVHQQDEDGGDPEVRRKPIERDAVAGISHGCAVL